MLKTEYQHRVAAKKAAVKAFDERKLVVRRKIAEMVLRDPSHAIRSAEAALDNKSAPWQQWSKSAWLKILRTKRPEEIAEMLSHPSGDAEALMDSHPFAGMRAAADGR